MNQEKKVRILCGSPGSVEHDINELVDRYAPIVWNVQPGAEGPLVTCVLVHESELRKAQIIAAGMPLGRRQ